MSRSSRRNKNRWGSQWPKTPPGTITVAGQPGAPLKLSPPLLLNTLDDVLKHVSLVARTAMAVPSSIERSQLRPPSLIADAPLKLWLKQLDSETLEVLYNKSVVECTKAKLLGQRDENAYRANRIREIARREIDYRRTYSPSGEDSV